MGNHAITLNHGGEITEPNIDVLAVCGQGVFDRDRI
jgi:hypothetical protein